MRLRAVPGVECLVLKDLKARPAQPEHFVKTSLSGANHAQPARPVLL
jgi:hypothetical protein